MRIHARPAITQFATGEVTAYAASVVGHAPHTTWYVEKALGLVPTPEAACAAVGELIQEELTERAIQAAVQEYGPQQAQRLMMEGRIQVEIPPVPGVTVPGEWKNPKFGNPEKHRKLFGLIHRSPETERQVIGEPERFHA